MPVYEYECQAKKCGAIIEEYQSINSLPLEICPRCKKGKVIRLISVPAKAFVPGDPRDAMQQAKREGKAMAKEILRGNEEVIADVLGESAITGKHAPKKAETTKKSAKTFKKR
jgi:putative FmdB family regulatory protein